MMSLVAKPHVSFDLLKRSAYLLGVIPILFEEELIMGHNKRNLSKENPRKSIELVVCVQPFNDLDAIFGPQ
jgi:hypothetical protein